MLIARQMDSQTARMRIPCAWKFLRRKGFLTTLLGEINHCCCDPFSTTKKVLTDDPTISLKNLLHVYLVNLESVEVSDEDARVDRVRVLGARLISNLAKIHRGKLL